MMRRAAHGATTRPPLCRPGSGYGRPLRPAPPAAVRVAAERSRRRVRAFAILLAMSIED